MTCNQMLERLIEADPDALAGRGGSEVASHVRECARCRAVAEQLLAETRMLAAAVEYGGAVVRRLRPAPIVLAFAAAAALAFALLPEQRPGAMPIGPSRLPVADVTPTTVTPVVVSPPLPPVVRPPVRPLAAATPAPRQVAVAYPPATPIAVTPMQVPAEISVSQVAVSLPAGKRAAVMRTSDPAMTVVWVY